MLDPDNHLDYHMDPPNTYNIICPLSDPITIKTKKEEYNIDIGEVWFINPSYAHASFHKSKEVRVAVLANFEYTEEVYDHLTRLL